MTRAPYTHGSGDATTNSTYDVAYTEPVYNDLDA